MKIHDILANFSSSLNNCIKTNKQICIIPLNNLILDLTKLFFTEGYFISYKIIKTKNRLYVLILLKKTNGVFAINKIKKISLQSKKKYCPLTELKKKYTFINGDTNYIMSTPFGVFPGKTCINKGISGEILYKIN